MPSPVHTRRRSRAAAAALAGLAFAASGADASEPSEIRVLLLESRAPVWVRGGAAGEGGTQVRPAGRGLRAGGRELGQVWRVTGGDVLSVQDRHVRGSLLLRRVGAGLQVVNQVGLEDYVAGTVGREVLSGWAEEALKAQAVVARTYALHERARHERRAYHVEAGTGSQVYGGVDAETPAVRAATRATRGQILVFEDEPILAVYHSASGGLTASAEEVWGRPAAYLVSVPVDGEELSPDTYWRASISGTKLGRALEPLGMGVGRVRRLRVVERSASGRARWVEVGGEAGERKVEAGALRRALGLGVIRSTLFEVRTAPDGFVFVGSGHGHGVGMSQWGAQAMAERGIDYREILATFYPGTRLTQVAAR
jgi:stage II sporulation protein D